MRFSGLLIAGAALLGAAQPALAQEDGAIDVGSSEIVVSGTRRSIENFDDKVPAVGLKRTADFAIQPIRITGDTREEAIRHEEMFQTIRRLIEGASAHGVQLAFGKMIVEPLTLVNYKDLTLERDSRPDTNRVELLVKAPLSAGGNAREALARIDRFLKSVKPVGRALVERNDDMTLSIVAPDQYRPDVAAKIAEDAAAMAAKFGPNYAVEVRGLNRPVEWARAGLTEVFLYVPYELVVVPRP
jgi:hypothetical protein